MVDGLTKHERTSQTRLGKCSLDLVALAMRLSAEPKGQSLSSVGQEGSGGRSLVVRADGGWLGEQVELQGRLRHSG